MIDASHAQTNGIHPGAPGIARAALLADRDPLGRVFELGDKASMTIAIALLVASVAHGAAAARATMFSLDLFRFARTVQDHVTQRLTDTYDIDVTKPEPEPPPEPEPEPAKAAPPPHAPKDAPPPPPPAAAKAGAVVTKEADPNEPVDLTNSFVTGPGTTYAGGVTQTGGTSNKAVYNSNARAGGTPGGKGPATAPPGPDRSRGAGLLGDTNWTNCPFPPEADSEDLNDAYVTVEVVVGTNGKAQQVTVLKDPGHGFAREARQCAMQKTFATQLDGAGNPLVGKTKPFRIHFER